MGIGRRMVEGLVRAVKRAEVRRLHLEVAADNAAALALYQRLGFAEVGRRKGYYVRKGRPPVDALLLALEL
jgi:ribosomal-protein-alanine N-acetyltransferase